MKLISENQMVGTYPGYAVFRNLYEDEVTGFRISFPTSKEFNVMDERTLTDGKLIACPSRELLFEKYKLR